MGNNGPYGKGGAKGGWGGWGGAAKGGWGGDAGKGKSKGKRERGPSGPDLERERITAEPFTGTVKVWKGKFGFITPEEPIDHPAASKSRDGDIWFSGGDITSGQSELEAGAVVSFHVYTDASGKLGAEEVTA